MARPLRVIQWATGNVGRSAIAGVAGHPAMDLVGCRVYADDKAGVDAGVIAGVGELGVAATTSDDEVLALDADVVVYSPMLPDADVVCRLLASGKNVVTPLGWFYPHRPDEVAAVRDAALGAGTTIHGTGIHPGGVTEKFPLMLSALVGGITHVRAEEFSDIRSYQAEFVVREIMLFGKSPDEAAASPMLDLLGNGFGQSVAMVADAVGFRVDDDLRADHAIAVATAPIDSPIGTIEPGQVAAQRFTWQATVDGEPVVTARTNWFMGDRGFEPDWVLGEQRFEMEVTGSPTAMLTLHGMHPPDPTQPSDPNEGIAATAMHCVNAIPAVVAAAPGIVSYLDLPPYVGAAATHLHR